MNIIVCVKQVIDPEAPPSSFKINAAGKAEMHGAPPVIDPYGEFAVEAALKVKEATGARVAVISLGAAMLREVVKKPLAMGADELVLLEDAAFGNLDSWATASALAAAIRKKGGSDLVLCGREASDTNAGQVGPGIAEILGMPCVTIARKIDVKDGTARVEKVTAVGYDIIEVPLPAVVTVSNEIGEPRYPTIKGIMAAKKVEPVVWKPADIGIGMAAKATVKKLYQPVYEGKCDFAEGDTPEEAAVVLAFKIREARIL